MCTVFSGLSAGAQTTVSEVSTTQSQIKPDNISAEKIFSLSTSIEYSQKVEVEQNVERERGTDINLVAGYKINSLYSVNAKTGFTKELSGPQNTTMANTTLGAAVKGIQINPETITTHGLSVVLPTSEVSQKRDRLNTSISLANGISYKGEIISAKYTLGLTKNFHEFEQNAEGAFLTEYRITNGLDLSAALTEKFSISVSGLYRTSFTYTKDQKYSFAIDSDLNYDLTEKLATNLGVSNEGSALKDNGADTNINIYDGKSSVFRAGITYTY